MREIFIISCWPDSDKRIHMLEKLISQLKELGKEIMVVSHHPIPAHISEMVDYSIYDRENPIYTAKTLDNYPADFFFTSTDFRLDGICLNHSAALSRIFNASLNFIKNLEYDYFTIIESDSEYDLDDLKKFDQIRSDLISNNKKLFFFKLRPYEFPYWENNGITEVYESYCFGGLVNEFIDKLYFPKTLVEWNKLLELDKNNHNLEYIISSAFKKNKDDYLILDSTQSVFSRSKINVCVIPGINGVYYNKNNENYPIVFLYNESGKEKVYNVSFNAADPIKVNLLDKNWWMFGINYVGSQISLKIDFLENSQIVDTNSIIINDEWLNLNKNRRTITFKTKNN